MQIAAFNARCPFEIGDKVQDGRTGAVHTITDIACIHYLKAGRVEFRYELNNSGQYIEIAVPTVEHIEIKVSYDGK